MPRLCGRPACENCKMHITSPCVVSLTWQLSDAQGHAIDALADPVEFFYGGSDLLAKIEEALQGQREGFETELHLEPEHAFGDYHAELVCFEARSLFPSGLEAGMAFEGLPPGSVTPDMPADAVYVVTEVFPSHVVLDGNHPLAGMALRLRVKVCDVREPDADELARRSIVGGMLSLMGAAPSAPDALH
jgi:FKBP-type peptidyl-prolyl cis-trans isomerase SlyD